jgi:hypothetical protein
MPTACAVHAGGNASILAAQRADPSCIASDVDLDPEILFEAVKGITYRYTTDSDREPCATIELKPPWRVNLAPIEIDGKRLDDLQRARFHLSNAKFATLLRQAGEALLVPNRCEKRLVQKWVYGEHKQITGTYQVAIAYVLGYDVETIRQKFPAARPEEDAQHLGNLARLTEALLVLADAYEKLRELNGRLASTPPEPDSARMCPACLTALTVSVPYAIHLLPRPFAAPI